jgi:WD repeat-containing protein 48
MQDYLILSLYHLLVVYFIMIVKMFQTTDSFSHVISGGRDRKIFMTDLRFPERPVLICEESAPILKMVMTPDQGSLWVATSESCIKNWVSVNK